jgi:D-beta-D-heptose 7-phosphate kinase/D-beta-D-heptose 1-phosphate adenosyltransferase
VDHSEVTDNFEALLQQFARKRILLLGDLVLDRYWWGDAFRLSPEAPVPVLLKRKVDAKPGGAANTAVNLVSLGADVEVLGAVGADAEARELQQALKVSGIRRVELVELSNRPTTTKTRLIAGHQHIVRVDEEEVSPLPQEYVDQVCATVRERLPDVDAIVLSDYAKGFLTPVLLQTVLKEARAAGVPTFADPKGLDVERYREVAYLKPNRMEAGQLAGMRARNHEDTLAAGRELRRRLPETNLLVTEAADGMTYFGTDGSEVHLAGMPQQVFDITGAGDTVMAAFALAVISGVEIREAIWIAIQAANIAIKVMGAARVTARELWQALEQYPIPSRGGLGV